MPPLPEIIYDKEKPDFSRDGLGQMVWYWNFSPSMYIQSNENKKYGKMCQLLLQKNGFTKSKQKKKVGENALWETSCHSNCQLKCTVNKEFQERN